MNATKIDKIKDTAAYEKGVTDGGRAANGQSERIVDLGHRCEDYQAGYRRGYYLARRMETDHG
jgi:hypothetical protein